VEITDESISISQFFWGHVPGLPPKVYAYAQKYYFLRSLPRPLQLLAYEDRSFYTEGPVQA